MSHALPTSPAGPGASPWRFVPLTDVSDQRGVLTVGEVGRELPFVVQRVFYVREVGEGQIRGGHAHRVLSEVLLAVAGTVDVFLDSGRESVRISLDARDRPTRGLYIPPLTWVEVGPFSVGSVCLVLADGPYDPSGIVGDHAQFRDEFAPRR